MGSICVIKCNMLVNSPGKNKNTYYMSAGFAGRHVVDFGDLNIDIFLEVQDNRVKYCI